MALLKFVRNVTDLSKDGGYQFRFCCDKCGDGYESDFVVSSANLLKTGLEIFSIFKPALGSMGRVAQGIDRGLSGKERDAAYEAAVHKAMTFFKKCTTCGKWVCQDNCWNELAGLCEDCAPNAEEKAARAGAVKRAKSAVANVQTGKAVGSGLMSCPVCQKMAKPGKFCNHCGSAMQALHCKKCRSALSAADKFCGNCGTSVK